MDKAIGKIVINLAWRKRKNESNNETGERDFEESCESDLSVLEIILVNMISQYKIIFIL
jgi:hypothetical protein